MLGLKGMDELAASIHTKGGTTKAIGNLKVPTALALINLLRTHSSLIHQLPTQNSPRMNE